MIGAQVHYGKKRKIIQENLSEQFAAYLEKQKASMARTDRRKSDRLKAALRTLWPRVFPSEASGIRTALFRVLADENLRSA